MKKTLSMLLAALLALSLVSVAFAENTEAPRAYFPYPAELENLPANFSLPDLFEFFDASADPDGSGRVESVELGGVAVPGKTLRRLFSLRSTAFSLTCTEAGFLFTVTGYGHGVGMSQYGAAVMAREGADYRRILAHYYPGTELVEGLKGP